jgi:hypothetical protein
MTQRSDVCVSRIIRIRKPCPACTAHQSTSKKLGALGSLRSAMDHLNVTKPSSCAMSATTRPSQHQTPRARLDWVMASPPERTAGPPFDYEGSQGRRMCLDSYMSSPQKASSGAMAGQRSAGYGPTEKGSRTMRFARSSPRQPYGSCRNAATVRASPCGSPQRFSTAVPHSSSPQMFPTAVSHSSSGGAFDPQGDWACGRRVFLGSEHWRAVFSGFAASRRDRPLHYMHCRHAGEGAPMGRGLR